MIRMAGVAGDGFTTWLTTIIITINATFTSLSLFFVERLGRRRLILASLLGELTAAIRFTLPLIIHSTKLIDIGKGIAYAEFDPRSCH